MGRLWTKRSAGGFAAMALTTAAFFAIHDGAVSASVCPAFGGAVQTGTVQSDTLVEASGLVASAKNPGVLWAANDGGSYENNNIEAMTPAGAHLATYHFTNGVGRDWEAMTRGIVGGNHYLYVVNNDNPAAPNNGWETVTIHRVAEPVVTPGQPFQKINTTADAVLTVRFPDNRKAYIETMMSDPITGDLLLGSKDNSTGIVNIFRYRAPHANNVTLSLDATVTLPLINGDNRSRAATDGTISDDGTEVVIRSNGPNQRAYLWRWDRAGGQSLSAALAGTRCTIPLHAEGQGETIAFTPGGETYFTVSEGGHQPVWSFARNPGRAFAPQVATGAITVDGALSEAAWAHGQADLPYALSRVILGTWNNTARWSALWSDTHLYVGARISDTALRNDSASPWDDDSIDVYLDGNHNHGASYDAADNQYVKGWNDTGLFAKNDNTSGVMHAWRAVPGGYEVELAIPWANLGQTATVGKVIGFDIAANDDDTSGARDGQAMAFGTTANWTDTRGFGDLTLASGETEGTTARKVAAAEVTVDGALSETAWLHGQPDLPYLASKVVIGVWNNTARYSVLWDETYLYVGVRVSDAVLRNDSINVWDDDSVDVYLDGDHNHGTVYDSADNQYSKGWNDTGLFVRQGDGSGVLHAWRAVSGGYELELAIPWTQLGLIPVTGTVIGFDVSSNDDDNGGTRDGQAVAFGTSSNWTDTSNFGDVVLTG